MTLCGYDLQSLKYIKNITKFSENTILRMAIPCLFAIKQVVCFFSSQIQQFISYQAIHCSSSFLRKRLRGERKNICSKIISKHPDSTVDSLKTLVMGTALISKFRFGQWTVLTINKVQEVIVNVILSDSFCQSILKESADLNSIPKDGNGSWACAPNISISRFCPKK